MRIVSASELRTGGCRVPDRIATNRAADASGLLDHISVLDDIVADVQPGARARTHPVNIPF
jgi:hypothetical protein